MTRYTVRWEVEVKEDNETAAAQEARRRQISPEEWDSIFWVIETNHTEPWPEAGWAQMDLLAPPETADDHYTGRDD